MPSIDVVNKVDMQEMSNAINNLKKEIVNRYDFRGVNTEITLDAKEKTIQLVVADEMKMEAVREMLLEKAIKRKLDLRCFDFGDIEPTAHGAVKRKVKIKEGIEREIASKIVKIVKESKIKVQASIQGDEVRLSGKQIDDIRAVMSLLNGSGLEVPLQYVNPKS